MIYRIHHDEKYQMHVIPPVESMNKLGAEHGIFAFNAEPIKYSEVWEALKIHFQACIGSKTKDMPDISENFGRLFLSTKAHDALKELIEEAGELLPITYNSDEKGYIFNPLLTAESLNAIDEKLTTYDAHGNLEHFSFDPSKLKNTAIFKTQLDTYKGIFCSEAVVQACELAGLTGVKFNLDISNPIGEAYSIGQ